MQTKNKLFFFNQLSQSLCEWYLQNKRDLPWRLNKDPYSIWISEIMLQQTTVQAVIPYFQKFMLRFPNVKALAQAPESEILNYWSGLGYYSRARNIHKAALLFAQTGFPQSYADLMKYPGLGPYTSRAVASLAFGEPVGVLDGNVIRILSRVFGFDKPWWKSSEREQLQKWADLLVLPPQDPAIANQGMMELGATICTPQSPSCTLCPWMKKCIALKEKKVFSLPLKKEKRPKEIWIWEPQIHLKQMKLAMSTEHNLPFLKKFPLPLGQGRLVEEKPKHFDFQHSITHHQIFVKIKKPMPIASHQKIEWVPLLNIKKHNPTSLLQKTLKHLQKEKSKL